MKQPLSLLLLTRQHGRSSATFFDCLLTITFTKPFSKLSTVFLRLLEISLPGVRRHCRLPNSVRVPPIAALSGSRMAARACSGVAKRSRRRIQVDGGGSWAFALEILRQNQALDLLHVLPFDKPSERITALVIAGLSRRRAGALITALQHLAAADTRHLRYHVWDLAQQEVEQRRAVGGHLQRLQTFSACILRAAEKNADGND